MSMAARRPKGSLTLRRQRMLATTREKRVSEPQPCCWNALSHRITQSQAHTSKAPSHTTTTKLRQKNISPGMQIWSGWQQARSPMQVASNPWSAGEQRPWAKARGRRQAPMGLAEAVTEGELLSRGLSDGLADPEHGTAHLKKAFN